MATTLKEILDGTMPETDYDLAVLSDKIWEIGDIDEIEAAVDPEVFKLFIAINTIGNWEGDGWGGIIGDQPVLVPYIPQAMEFIGCSGIAEAFRNVVSVFPDFTEFSDDGAYCDIINFLINVRFKVKDKRLDRFSKEERAELSERFHKEVEELEQITGNLWSGSDGWKIVFEKMNLILQN